MLKYYFPFYKNKFCFSARSLFLPYSQQLEEPRKMDFGDVPLIQHIGENARKLANTGAENALDFFAHAHILKVTLHPQLINGIKCTFLK